MSTDNLSLQLRISNFPHDFEVHNYMPNSWPLLRKEAEKETRRCWIYLVDEGAQDDEVLIEAFE